LISGPVESPVLCWKQSLSRCFAEAQFTDVRITERFDCFEGTSKEKTARRYGVIGVNLSAFRSA
jgi:hypothetical protein